MNYTVLQLRGGTKSEHLVGAGEGFVGERKEITVDTTDWTLRVHDGDTVGGHALAKELHQHNANDIIFSDGDTLQYKFDNGQLGGNGNGENPEPTPPTNTPPRILTIGVSNILSNGNCDITYLVEDNEESEFTHSFSRDNGVNFTQITPSGTSPYSYKVTSLPVGSNICAIKVSDGEMSSTKYFVVEVPNPSADTAPSISNLHTSDVTTSGFKIYYKATDKENHAIRNHKLSLDNGYSYTEVFPNLVNDLYEIEIDGLNAGTTYFCRVRVSANGLDSNPYGFQVTTQTVSTLSNPLITDGINVYKLVVRNNSLSADIVGDINDYTHDEKVYKDIVLSSDNELYKITIRDEVICCCKK